MIRLRGEPRSGTDLPQESGHKFGKEQVPMTRETSSNWTGYKAMKACEHSG